MHEYGLVRDLLAQIDETVREQAGRRAVRVIVCATGVSGAEERVLREAFATFRAGTSASQAELLVDRMPSQVCCLDCGVVAIPADGWCSLCGGGAVVPAGRRDFWLKSVEIEV